jgi:quercetin dioxygenase-like cupin family protein
MTDGAMATRIEFHEPTSEDQPAGLLTYRRRKGPYETFMEEEGIPIFRGIGVRDTREVELGPWQRLGGRGAFLYLDGIGNQKGMFVLEVPSGAELNPERHMYDEFFLVIEGRGTTEVWRDGKPGRDVFEWQPGSLFMAPINTWHRLVNASSRPALLVAANNAPPVMNLYQSRRFVFDNSFDFEERFDGSDDFFKAKTDVEAEPVRGRAAIRSNFFADIVNCELPLDNQRAPGYRRIQPYFHGFLPTGGTGGFVAQYPSGRYSKAHFHQSGAVLVCLRGKGYTFNWPVELGPRPWENGHGDKVKVQEYVPGGLVAAAPGGGTWFHQHFSIGNEPLRVINYWGGPTGSWGGGARRADDEDDEVKAGNIFGYEEGGITVHYHQEDPFIRTYYAQRLKEEGVELHMPDSLFSRA